MLNSSARNLVRRATENGVGILDMFAVRRAFRSMEELHRQLDRIIEDGLIDREALEQNDPFAHAIESGECVNLTEMAYRYCLHEPGIDVVLFGTGSIDHLRENRRTADLAALGKETRGRIDQLLGSIHTVSGN